MLFIEENLTAGVKPFQWWPFPLDSSWDFLFEFPLTSVTHQGLILLKLPESSAAPWLSIRGPSCRFPQDTEEPLHPSCAHPTLPGKVECPPSACGRVLSPSAASQSPGWARKDGVTWKPPEIAFICWQGTRVVASFTFLPWLFLILGSRANKLIEFNCTTGM